MLARHAALPLALAAYLAGACAQDPGSGQDCNSDACVFSSDGECDDGGAGAEYSRCRLSSDVADCGPRACSPCEDDTCAVALDGDCDDGGPGSEFSKCAPGTDRTDCSREGPQSFLHCSPPRSPPPMPPAAPSPAMPPLGSGITLGSAIAGIVGVTSLPLLIGLLWQCGYLKPKVKQVNPLSSPREPHLQSIR